jgi:hypothetical protein
MSAQLTEAATGCIYVRKARKPREDCCKIVRTNNPERRPHEFGVTLPFKVEPVLVIRTGDAHVEEKTPHEVFADKRIDGEWCRLNVMDIESTRHAPPL